MSLRAFSKVQIIFVCSVGRIISKRRLHTRLCPLALRLRPDPRLGASPRRLAPVIVGFSDRPYSRIPDPLGSLTFCSLAESSRSGLCYGPLTYVTALAPACERSELSRLVWLGDAGPEPVRTCTEVRTFFLNQTNFVLLNRRFYFRAFRVSELPSEVIPAAKSSLLLPILFQRLLLQLAS